MPDYEFGSDGQIHDMTTGTLVPQPESLGSHDEAASADSFEASEPGSAAQRLRAFEDEHVGPDAVRINDRIERGSGSPFQALPEEKRRAYQAIEKTVETERKLAEAHAALLAADEKHEAAVAAAEDAARFGG